MRISNAGSACGNSVEIDPRVTLHLAAAVVVQDDRVLVVRRSETERFLPRVWGVPCGKVDPGESLPDAALRELREETGLVGGIVGYLGRSTFSSIWRGRAAENIQSNFLVRPLGVRRKVRLPKKDQAAIWLSRDEIHHFDGLDTYNRGVLQQWLHLGEFGQSERISSALIASSSRR